MLLVNFAIMKSCDTIGVSFMKLSVRGFGFGVPRK